MVVLQTRPEAFGSPEEPRQPQAGIGGDGAVARDDFADASLRHADFLGKPILRDAHRLQEFLQQDFAGRGIGDGAHSNGSVVINNLDFESIAIAPDEADPELIIDADAVLASAIAAQHFETEIAAFGLPARAIAISRAAITRVRTL